MLGALFCMMGMTILTCVTSTHKIKQGSQAQDKETMGVDAQSREYMVHKEQRAISQRDKGVSRLNRNGLEPKWLRTHTDPIQEKNYVFFFAKLGE